MLLLGHADWLTPVVTQCILFCSCDVRKGPTENVENVENVEAVETVETVETVVTVKTVDTV